MADLRAQLLAAFDIEHRDHLESVRRALAAPAEADLREVFRRLHSLKGAARAVDLEVVEHLAHRLEERLAQVIDAGRGLDPASVDLIHLGLDAIEGQAAAQREGQPLPDASRALAALGATPSPTTAGDIAPAPASPAGPPSGERAPEYVRIDSQLGDSLSESLHHLSSEVQIEAAQLEMTQRLRREAAQLERLWGEMRAKGGRDRNAARSLAFERGLQNLSRNLGELTRRQARANWAVSESLTALREQINEVTLTPAESVLGDLGRMVRDLAREQGLEVDVRIEGLEVRAERRVLQALREPIIHLLRNAVSHGGEPAKVRAAAGKDERLHVTLRALARGGRLEIYIADDGAGPDLARIEAAAVERGLLPPREPGAPLRQADEILAMAFEPGVSAAQTVDRLSGRGMGLSAVSEALTALGGSARLLQRRPAGTEVVLSAPLSAARQTLVVAEAGGALFGLPSFAIKALLRLRASDMEIVEGAPSARIQIDGSDIVTPVIPLSTLIHESAPAPLASDAATPLILIHRGERHLLLAVDEITDVRELTVQDLDDSRLAPGLTLGAAILGEDRPLLVLNPEALIDRWLRNARRLSISALGLANREDVARQVRTVLVVDDSITTRTLEKSILEAQGYRVILAVDGVDALNTLRSSEALIDLVVADIEMPRMDGFSLLQAIKADAGLANLPVILMTSRNDEADVRRGLDLGAEAYITKQKFDQRELFATIGRIL
ncbi:MAG: response regulator [Phenylobacterium sp.]|uniref:hybrid sensor histidine kinase/response regulator n=1 Tax=Phenylobacterium sp. TaxID=1871053 RepID=UPI002728B766|nr:response regulator [Phenylobacterium sp.]MDO8901886.1 response regulator [Phenylobacterium sp.]